MRLPPVLVAAALAAALAATAPPALADRAVGRLAPELDASEGWNLPFTPFSLRALRGRLVVLELFRVDCPHCQASVARLHAIQAARFDAGVRVVGACRQPAERIAAYVRDFRVTFPVVRVSSELMEDYEIAGYPAVFVVGGDGLVLWSGDPTRLDDATLDRLQRAAGPWTALADSVRGAAQVLRGDDATTARALLVPCAQEREGCDTAQAEASERMLAWIDAWAATLDAVASDELGRGEAYEAWLALDLLSRAFAGSPEGALARARIDAMRAVAATRREVDGGLALAAARRLVVAGEAARAVRALEQVVADHPGTKAAARAAAVAARQRKRAP